MKTAQLVTLEQLDNSNWRVLIVCTDYTHQTIMNDEVARTMIKDLLDLVSKSLFMKLDGSEWLEIPSGVRYSIQELNEVATGNATVL